VADPLPHIGNGSADQDIVAYILGIQARYPADSRIAAQLASALAASGDQIQPRSVFSADVASTGGPSSLSTLLCPLYLRVAGAVVPKLGVPGRPAGGIDCLIQIDGYQSTFDVDEVEHLLDEFGYAHFLAGGRLAPLDGRMFELRQQHGAQDVPTLVAASLLSKKLAVGVRHAGLDIRVAPHGNFGKTWSEASGNAHLFIEAARLLSIEAFPVLTDARYPYQPFIGRKEALLALHHVFNDTASRWLDEHRVLCRDLALACTPPENRDRILSATPTDLREQFYLNLTSQGASPEAFELLVESTASRHTHVLRAFNDGFVRFGLDGMRRVLVESQKRHVADGAAFRDPVGIILLRRPGDWVRGGEPLATVRIDDESSQGVLHDLERHVANTAAFPVGPTVEGITTDE
jgi:thymidine phosphorylase